MFGDGGIDFRSQHTAKVRQALEEGLCQVCGTELGELVVLLGGPEDVKRLLFHEPPMHPVCAVYTSRACPVVAGHATELPAGPTLSEGRRGEHCDVAGCDCAGWVSTPGEHEGVGPRRLHSWFAVYATGFRPVYRETGGILGALVYPYQVRWLRRVSEPGAGRCWTRVAYPAAGVDMDWVGGRDGAANESFTP